MSDYMWTFAEQLTYDWPSWARSLFRAPKRWQNPICDVGAERHLDRTLVESSEPIEWPDELRDLEVDFGPPRQKPYQGSVGGKPVQSVNPDRTRRFTVHNKYRGNLIVDGVEAGPLDGPYQVDVPVPYQNGWGVEGYPNGGNLGDRHWYGVEPDGTAHEMIWFNQIDSTCAHYAKYAPDGTITHRVDPGGSVVKGNVQWTSLALNQGDPAHRLGLVFHNLGATVDHSVDDQIVRFGNAGSDGDADWDYPRYGQWFRLSRAAYDRLSVGVTDIFIQSVLDSAHYHGFIPYDRGGQTPGASVGMIGGGQHERSKLAQIRMGVKDLERVTG